MVSNFPRNYHFWRKFVKKSHFWLKKKIGQPKKHNFELEMLKC